MRRIDERPRSRPRTVLGAAIVGVPEHVRTKERGRREAVAGPDHVAVASTAARSLRLEAIDELVRNSIIDTTNRSFGAQKTGSYQRPFRYLWKPFRFRQRRRSG